MKLRLSLQKKAEEIEKELKDIQFADKDSYSSYKAFDGMEEGDIYIVTKDKSRDIFCATWGKKYDGTILERPDDVRYALLDSSRNLCMVLADSIQVDDTKRFLPEKELFALPGLFYMEGDAYHVRILTQIRDDKEIPLIFKSEFVRRWGRLQYNIEEIDEAIAEGLSTLEAEEV
ncbi:MAG: hypothetical protein WBV47_05720 [Salegentibacter sp.]